MPNRRLVVDLLGFNGTRGGTETYVRELLPRVSERLLDIDVVALTGRAGADDVIAFAPGEVHVLRWVGADRLTWALGAVLGTPWTASRLGADLVWCPANFGPLTGKIPTVVTVHDAIYHSVQGRGVQRVTRRVTAALSTGAARRARKVLTVSQAAAGDIERYVGVEPRRIIAVPNGVAPPVPVTAGSPRARLGLPEGRRVVASVGNAMPHKNLSALVRAIARLPLDRRPHTVIVGSGVPRSLQRLAAQLGVAEDVTLLGWVTPEVLEDVYAAADLYVCVSVREGFGLPVADAMQRSVAVLANDIPVLREVGGDVATYVDARDPELIATALDTLLSDAEELADRAAKGPAHAGSYTWDAAASRIARVLLSAMGPDS